MIKLGAKDVHDLKKSIVGDAGRKFDTFVDKKTGDIYLRTKRGAAPDYPGEHLGNVND